MGVFTVGRQVALEIDMPGWWLANASVDMDFRRGLYYDSSTPNPLAATNFLSCIRASIGYAKTSTGALTSFASNTLRLTDLGLLVENAATNLQFSSQAFTTADWGGFQATALDNQTDAPDGTTTAGKLTEDTNAGRHMRQANSFVVIPNPGVVSVYAKAGTRSYVGIGLNGGSSDYNVVFDLALGAVGLSSTSTPATIEAFTNGWYRCSIYPQTAVTSQVVLFLSDSANPTIASNAANYTGNGSSFAYFWGAQVESGAFDTSYVPTGQGAAATRAADNITTSGSLQTTINSATGSLVAQTDNGGGAGFAANIVDSNGTNLLGFNASNNALASISATLATGNTGNRTTQDKLGLAWNASGRSLVLNGGTVATDATAQTPSATQHIGSSGSANFAFAYVERLTAFNMKLADATLQGFTV